MTTKKPIVFIRVQPETKEALLIAAKADKRSVANLLDKIAVDWLKANGYLK